MTDALRGRAGSSGLELDIARIIGAPCECPDGDPTCYCGESCGGHGFDQGHTPVHACDYHREKPWQEALEAAEVERLSAWWAWAREAARTGRRDPRVDPRIGDVVVPDTGRPFAHLNAGTAPRMHPRLVISAGPRSVYFTRWPKSVPLQQHRVTLDQWRAWAADGVYLDSLAAATEPEWPEGVPLPIGWLGTGRTSDGPVDLDGYVDSQLFWRRYLGDPYPTSFE